MKRKHKKTGLAATSIWRSEKQTELTALIVSIVCHALLFLIYFPVMKVQPSEPITYRIPVSLEMGKPDAPKEVVGPTMRSNPSTGSTDTTQKGDTTKVSEDSGPKSLPGDRSEAVVAGTVEPIYPKTALNNNWKGTVRIKFTVSKEGRAKDFVVTKSSGYELLDQTFIRTVEQFYEFKPKRVMGKDMESTSYLEYTFDPEK